MTTMSPPAARAPLLAVFVLLTVTTWLMGVAADAQPQPEAPDGLGGASDPLEIARRVDRLGDTWVLSRLSDATPRRVRLESVRAAPFLGAPEAALPFLMPIARGRDPVLAPAAARSMLGIARELSSAGLSAREASSQALLVIRVSLGQLVDDATARSDIRRMAALAASELDALFASDE